MEGNTAEGVIDAHHHVWDLAVRDQDWVTGPELAPLRRDFTLADLEPEARAAGVTATVLVQTIDVPEEWEGIPAPHHLTVTLHATGCLTTAAGWSGTGAEVAHGRTPVRASPCVPS
jgi:L-fuconolactonase